MFSSLPLSDAAHADDCSAYDDNDDSDDNASESSSDHENRPANNGAMSGALRFKLLNELNKPVSLPLGPQEEQENDADLCPQCASIDLHKAFSERITATGGHSIAKLGIIDKTWSAKKCPLCRMIAAVCPMDKNDKDCQYELFAFSSTRILTGRFLISWDHFLDPWLDTMLLGVVNGDEKIDPEERTQRALESGFIGRVGSNCLHGKQSISVSPLEKYKEADLELAKSWVRCCCETHSKRCNPKKRGYIPEFSLIDCTTREIVKQEKVPTPAYVALSYVWGQGNGLNPEWIQVDGQVHRLRSMDEGGVEPVVDDAIHVTLKLGYRYLWVDRYCIDQHGTPEMKRRQFGAMHTVYHNADMTLVMADGTDSLAGLARSSSRRSRPAMPSACVQGHQLSCIPPEPRGLISSAFWSTRGWTYQEGIFSRRRLFFSQHEISFECYSLVCREAVRFPPRLLQLIRDQKPPLLKHAWMYRGRGLKTSRMGGYDLFVLLKEYMSRDLTNSADAIHAMRGILQSFSERKDPVYNLSGIPILHTLNWSNSRLLKLPPTNAQDGGLPNPPLSGFLSGLCWTLQETASPRPSFPSWSWAGWHGVVAGYPPNVCYRTGFDVEVSIIHSHDTMAWDDYYRQLVHLTGKNARLEEALPDPEQLSIRACAGTVQLYQEGEGNDWRGAMKAGDGVFEGDFSLTWNGYPPNSDQPKERNPSIEPGWHQRLLTESWLGIVLRYDHDNGMHVLVLREKANKHWERIGLLSFMDISMKSNFLEHKTLILE